MHPRSTRTRRHNPHYVASAEVSSQSRLSIPGRLIALGHFDCSDASKSGLRTPFVRITFLHTLRTVAERRAWTHRSPLVTLTGQKIEVFVGPTHHFNTLAVDVLPGPRQLATLA